MELHADSFCYPMRIILTELTSPSCTRLLNKMHGWSNTPVTAESEMTTTAAVGPADRTIQLQKFASTQPQQSSESRSGALKSASEWMARFAVATMHQGSGPHQAGTLGSHARHGNGASSGAGRVANLAAIRSVVI
mmetsp:Transcript_5397/g.9337  ORF Transcript_5397/g.9337 Transcript_5397/m.9337 type:complete len:135 (-) Transcript_5397:622-1026(-)